MVCNKMKRKITCIVVIFFEKVKDKFKVENKNSYKIVINKYHD